MSIGILLYLDLEFLGGNSKNSNPKFTRERQIFHYTFLFDAYDPRAGAEGTREEEHFGFLYVGVLQHQGQQTAGPVFLSTSRGGVGNIRKHF